MHREKSKASTIPPKEKLRGHNVSVRVPNLHFDQLVGIALVENTTLGAQMRAAIASYLQEKFTNPEFVALLEQEMNRRQKLMPPPKESES
jgi:hypothetical protein